jgi:alkanesulfonate monooxygenase SsuD/methylene tetrahydromethanopterin reductase-like flavin-dependent oxidoreductase (luciferase family)
MGQGAQLAEAAGLDFLLLQGDPDHGPIGQDPLSVAAFLMTATHALGLIASVPQSWAPFNVARALASFDRLSGGRCGWLPLPGELGADQAAEHLDVVLQLFDSWDDDALVFDKAAAVFADRDKVRRIRHAGAFYTVDGPLNAPRPLQGWPVLVQPLAQATSLTDLVLVRLDEIDPGARPAFPSESARLIAEVPVTADIDPELFLEVLAEAFVRGDCDGFLFAPADPEGDMALLAQSVLPGLKARGLLEPPSALGDLRARLGLPRPANRFSGRP